MEMVGSNTANASISISSQRDPSKLDPQPESRLKRYHRESPARSA